MSVKENYKLLLQRVEQACQRVQRDSAGVRIMAVCKEQKSAHVREAYECGIRLMGENRVQESEQHMRDLSRLAIEWHFIGKMQKNKINRILTMFNFIQSVDGVKTLEHIHKRVDAPVAVFLEVNIGEEESKSGFTVEGLKKAVPYISTLNKVLVTGLLTIPPFSDDPEASRPHFARLRELRNSINAQKIANMQIAHLSMGMSQDFEVAVEEGATIVRIGTFLFGKRRD